MSCFFYPIVFTGGSPVSVWVWSFSGSILLIADIPRLLRPTGKMPTEKQKLRLVSHKRIAQGMFYPDRFISCPGSVFCDSIIITYILLYYNPFFKKNTKKAHRQKNSRRCALCRFSARIRSVPDRCSQERRVPPQQNGSRSQAPTGAQSDRLYRGEFETLFSSQKYHQPCPDRQLLSFLPFRMSYYII